MNTPKEITPILDDETMDNEMYYQMIQDEKEIIAQEDNLIFEDELDYKEEHINYIMAEIF